MGRSWDKVKVPHIAKTGKGEAPAEPKCCTSQSAVQQKHNNLFKFDNLLLTKDD